MRKPASLIHISRRKFTYFIVILISLVSVTPVLAEYIGPQRTVTETINACKIVLLECQYVSSKDDYLYHKVNEWSCSNESRPWRDYPSEPPRNCSNQALHEKYWERDEIPKQVTTTYPPATISSTLQNCTLNNGWCITAPHISLIGSEPVVGHSILAIEGTRNGQTFACSGSSCNVPLVEGANNLTFWAFSSFTDTSLMGTWSAKVDTQQPTITGTLTGTAGSNGWYTGPVTLNGAASDSIPGSGLASFTCTLDGTPLSSCASIPVNGDGMHTLSLTARDQAGNVRTLTQNASIDSQNPVLAASISGTGGSNDWYTEAALNASASDPAPGSGLSVFEYNLDNSSWTPFPSAGTLTLPEGNHTIDLRAVDQAGLTATSSRSFLLDRVIPSIAIHASGTVGIENWYTTPLSISASAADETSGMAVFEYSLDNDVWTAYSGSLLLEDGIHTLSFWAEDQAGLGTQEDRNYKVDSRPPQIAGSISGTPGEDGWFISNVTLSASASDPAPGSGIDAFNYILNEDSETSYSEALNLSDGQHTVQLHARDKAGLTYSLEESVKVDTLLPSLQVDTTLPAWVKNTVTLSGTASDEGSGLSSVDISLDGGSTWQALESADSWSYIWNTLNSSSGMQEILLRTRDHAGLVFQQSLKTGVDNRPPSVNLPAAWYQWDTVTLDVWDDHSGLTEVLVEISDPEGRWPSRIIQLDEAQFPLQFTWDRRFGDGTKAPAGTYDLKLTATDQLGHSTIGTASIKVLLTILPPGPTSTPQPPARPTFTPTATFIPTASPTIVSTQTSVVWTFGATPEPNPLSTPTPGTIPTLRVTPTQTNVEEWFESVFGSVSGASESTTEIGTLDETAPNATPQESGVLWGAAAAAMMGAMTSYALDEKRKREEEKAQQALQEAEEEERRNKARAQKMEKLEEQWALERLWEQARLDAEQDKQLKKQERELRDQIRMDAQLLQRGPEAEEGARWYANQDAIRERYEKKLRDEEEKSKAEELQEGLAAYYNARKQGETTVVITSKEKPWYEKGLEWIDNHQTEIALGIGVVVGVGAIIASGGLATPLVAAAWVAGAATVAAGTVAVGTAALNLHYGRQWNENLLKNVAIAGTAAAVVTGAGFLFNAATLKAMSYCSANIATCGLATPVFKIIDSIEETWIKTKLTYQLWKKDEAGASETALELHSEYADGGMPGNFVLNEVADQLKDLNENALRLYREYGDDVIPLIVKYGDDALDIIRVYGNDGITLIQLYGYDAIELLQKYGQDVIPLLKANGVDAIKLSNRLTPLIGENTLKSALEQSPEAVIALSHWTDDELAKYGDELVSRASTDAIAFDAAVKLSKIEDLQGSEAKNLLRIIAKNSIQGDGSRIILGKWFDGNFDEGFIGVARAEDANFYGPSRGLETAFNGLNPQQKEQYLWAINQAALEEAINSGWKIDYSFDGLSTRDIDKEIRAIDAIAVGNSSEVAEIYGRFPFRMREIEFLVSQGYIHSIDETTQIVHWFKP